MVDENYKIWKVDMKMLLTKELEMQINSRMTKLSNHLESKGYTVIKERNKWGNIVPIEQVLKINTEDLMDNSTDEIEYLCDYCLEEGKETITKTTYQRYNQNRIKSIIKKDACKKCTSKKLKDVMVTKYGVENISQLEEIKKKKESTCIEHYGVSCNLTLDETKEKIKQTNLERYGVENPSKNEKIKEKARKTNLKRYGVEWTAQNPETIIKKKNTFLKKYGTTTPTILDSIKEKAKNTNIERYGVENQFQRKDFKDRMIKNLKEKYGENIENVSQIEEVKIKKAETFYKNGSIATSNQQRYIWKIIGGELNYSNKTPSLDIAFPNKKIYIEYNGSGHSLPVKTGWMSKREFDNKERRRYHYLKNQGWKGIFINSPYDYLPDDEVIISEINKAMQWFNIEGNGHYHYNIDIGRVINDVNYGKLRKIRKEDLDKFDEAI